MRKLTDKKLKNLFEGLEENISPERRNGFKSRFLEALRQGDAKAVEPVPVRQPAGSALGRVRTRRGAGINAPR